MTALKTTDRIAATRRTHAPEARPTPMARKTYTASLVSFSVERKRTAATIPARENASARLNWTMKTMPATAMGRMSIACTTDSSYPLRCLVRR